MGIPWGVKYRHVSAIQTQHRRSSDKSWGEGQCHISPALTSDLEAVTLYIVWEGRRGTAEHKSPPSPTDDAVWSLMHPDNLWLLYCLAISLVLSTCLCSLLKNIYCVNFNWLTLHNHSNPLAENQVRLKFTAWCEANIHRAHWVTLFPVINAHKLRAFEKLSSY